VPEATAEDVFGFRNIFPIPCEVYDRLIDSPKIMRNLPKIVSTLELRNTID
jgi:hypothetical protein